MANVESTQAERMAACNSRNTKLPELAFHAVLSDGAQEMRFEHLAVKRHLSNAATRNLAGIRRTKGVKWGLSTTHRATRRKRVRGFSKVSLRRWVVGEGKLFVFRRISAWRWAPGCKKEGCNISSEAPIGDSAAVTTPLIDEEPRVRDASRRFLEQLSRVARVALATDHEGRSAYLPEPSRGIESILRFHRGNHVGWSQ